MIASDTPARRVVVILVLGASLALAGCGASGSGSPQTSTQASTPAPATPAPATAMPTDAPTAAISEAPSAAPTAVASATATANPADLGGFAFKPGDVLDYYTSNGFECRDPQPSAQATGYTTVRCLKSDGSAAALVTLVVSDGGITGNAFAGYLNPAGSELPDQKTAGTHLAGFLAAMLGTDLGTEAAMWLGQNFGTEGTKSSFGGISTIIYGEDDKGGIGYYVEVANDDFLNAPTP